MRGPFKHAGALVPFALLLSFFPVSAGSADMWPAAVAQPEREAQKVGEDGLATKTSPREERKSLEERISQLKEEVKLAEKAFMELKGGLEESLDVEKEIQARLETEEREIHVLEGVVRSIAKDTELLVRESLITSEVPHRMESIRPLLDPKYFPRFEDIRNLVEIHFQEMERSKEVVGRKGKFIGTDGKETSGDILRIGNLAVLYRSDTEVGYLRYDERGDRMSAVPAELPWSARRTLKKYLAGESDVVPLDFSRGAVLERMGRHRGMGDWLRSGGLLVWPILLVGLVALLLILERSICLGRIKANSDAFMEKLQTLVSKGLWRECREFCSLQSSMPTCKVLERALENMGTSREILEDAIQEAILKELPRLERFLPTLSVLAAVAPLLGLLGTVSGMIKTFQVITVLGTGDAKMMSGGISEALITTQLGLSVAIPVMIVHNFLERRVDRIVGDMEEKGVTLSVLIMKNGEGTPGVNGSSHV